MDCLWIIRNPLLFPDSHLRPGGFLSVKVPIRAAEGTGRTVDDLVLSYLTPVSRGISRRQLEFQRTLLPEEVELASLSEDLHHILPHTGDSALSRNDLHGEVQHLRGRLRSARVHGWSGARLIASLLSPLEHCFSSPLVLRFL